MNNREYIDEIINSKMRENCIFFIESDILMKIIMNEKWLETYHDYKIRHDWSQLNEIARKWSFLNKTV